MTKSIDKSLDIYLDAVENKDAPKITPSEHLIKIGELAEDTNESVSTLRYWVKLGLL